MDRSLAKLLFRTTPKSLPTAILACLFVVWILVRTVRRSRALPPGPKKVHLLTTTYESPPPQEPWKAYAKWAKGFRSPLIYLRLRGRQILVLNKFHGAIELLEKRWSNYSSRPDFPMMDLIGRQNNVGFQRYGPKLKHRRKILHDAIGARARDIWVDLVDQKCIASLGALLNSPHEYEGVVHQFMSSIVVQFTYGREPDDDFFHMADLIAKDNTIAMQPGRWLVDTYPWLKHLPAWAPGGGFHAWTAEALAKFHEFARVPFDKVKAEMESGSARPSFVHDQLVKGDLDPEAEATVAGIAASLFSAGSDTMAVVLLTFFLVMLHYPEVQEKAFQEISSVIGPDRLPDMRDASRLPYIEALIKELHRFQPPVPVMPRSPETEDYFEGFRIPKKSMLLTNIWAMTHDEDEYQNPNSFNPDRFLACNNKQTIPRDPRDMTFGFGRRRCPGLTLANTALFLAISRIIAVFKVVPIEDSNGNKQLPPLEFTTAFISLPKPFKCSVIPRSDASRDLIKQLQLNRELS